MVDPWFPISMNKAKHHSKEKPLDEAKIAELLDLLDNILAGLTEWSKRVYTPSLCHYLVQKKEKFHAWILGPQARFSSPEIGQYWKAL